MIAKCELKICLHRKSNFFGKKKSEVIFYTVARKAEAVNICRVIQARDGPFQIIMVIYSIIPCFKRQWSMGYYCILYGVGTNIRYLTETGPDYFMDYAFEI